MLAVFPDRISQHPFGWIPHGYTYNLARPICFVVFASEVDRSRMEPIYMFDYLTRLRLACDITDLYNVVLLDDTRYLPTQGIELLCKLTATCR